MVQLFSTYPESLIAEAIDPVRGLPSRYDFPPTLKQARDFLEVQSGFLVARRQQAERSSIKTLLGNFEPVMREHISPENFWSWFAQARLEAHDVEQITLSVRSGWFATEIRKRFEQQILKAANTKRLILKIDQSLQNVDRGPAPLGRK